MSCRSTQLYAVCTSRKQHYSTSMFIFNLITSSVHRMSLPSSCSNNKLLVLDLPLTHPPQGKNGCGSRDSSSCFFHWREECCSKGGRASPPPEGGMSSWLCPMDTEPMGLQAHPTPNLKLCSQVGQSSPRTCCLSRSESLLQQLPRTGSPKSCHPFPSIFRFYSSFQALRRSRHELQHAMGTVQ